MNKLLTILFLFFTIGLQAQFFEGSGNNVGNIGYKHSDFSYISVGGSYNFTKFVSVGINFMYTFEDELEKPFFIEVRADVHPLSFLELEKSDLRVGYHYESGYHGTHAIYEYAFTEFFGLFGRGNYYFTKNNEDSFNNKYDESMVNFEAGIIFRIYGASPSVGF
jgi:hypothetical protein